MQSYFQLSKLINKLYKVNSPKHYHKARGLAPPLNFSSKSETKITKACSKVNFTSLCEKTKPKLILTC